MDKAKCETCIHLSKSLVNRHLISDHPSWAYSCKQTKRDIFMDNGTLITPDWCPLNKKPKGMEGYVKRSKGKPIGGSDANND